MKAVSDANDLCKVRKGRLPTVWLAFASVCFAALVLGILTWQSAGSPSPSIRRDRLGENLHLKREKGPLVFRAGEGFLKPVVRDVVRFTDEVLLLVQLPARYRLPPKDRLSCCFGNATYTDVSGAKVYRFRTAAVRCPYPPAGFAWQAGQVTVEVDGKGSFRQGRFSYRKPLAWKSLVYDMWSTEDDVVLFVKGLSRTRDHLEDWLSIRCVYNGTLEVPVSVAVQEVVRCPHPEGPQRDSLRSRSLTVKVNDSLFPSVVYYEQQNRAERHDDGVGESKQKEELVPKSETLERFFRGRSGTAGVGGTSQPGEVGEDFSVSAYDIGTRKHFLCACNLIWNGAKFLREWVMYHSFLGVDKFFLYDNNSDDELEEIIRELISNNFQIVRVPWPWIKAQESGFAHCALLAEQECTWMMYTDVDEYAFPRQWLNLSLPAAGNLDGRSADVDASLSHMGSRSLPPEARGIAGSSRAYVQAPLASLILDSIQPTEGEKDVGQISMFCRDFGPSGLTQHPVQGLTVGYTCRVAATQRHKSIVLLAAIDRSLKNVIHHFDVSPEYRAVHLTINRAVINHYKYQAWEEFRAKFKRRVSAYVVDWTQSKNLRSQDRAPGLGNKAVKPENWEEQFCEVQDYALRDYVLRVFSTGTEPVMVWE